MAMTPQEARAYFYSFTNYEIISPSNSSFQLERVVHFLRLLGDPQKKLKCIHVAGTKGKGSTCAFTAYILREAGFRVGLYTSPHLHDLCERIRILTPTNKEDISPFAGSIKEDELAGYVQKIKSVIGAYPHDPLIKGLTFFEIFTGIALLYFAENGVDFVVLETGLGGRLDATNAVDSLVCAITPISLEHAQLLGATVGTIAREKAGIIKNKNQITVIAPQEESAAKVIEQRCRDVGARAVWLGKDIRVKIHERTGDIGEGSMFDVYGRHEYVKLKMGLLGKHQAVNAAVAIGIVEALGPSPVHIREEAVRKGIERTVWPGRFEIVQRKPLVILDGAHNVASARALVETFEQVFPKRKAVFLLSMAQDKDKRGICWELNRIADKIILTKSNHPRASNLTIMNCDELFKGKEIFITQNSRQALEKAFQITGPNDIILATGSLFLVGEIRAICTKQV